MTFTGQDLGLVAIAGLLLGWLAGRQRAPRENRDRLVAQLVSAVLEPIFYWLDLRGPDKLPSNSKVVYLATLVFLLAGIVTFGLKELQQQGSVGLSLNYILYVVIVCCYSLGPKTFNAFLTKQLGEKLAPAMQVRASGGFTPPPTATP